MNRRLYRPLFATLLLTLFLTGSVPAAKQKSNGFGALANEILGSLEQFYPVRATEMGIHTWDHSFTDYSGPSIKKKISTLQGYKRRLEKITLASLPTYEQINYRLLQSNLERELQMLQHIQPFKRWPETYVREAIDGIYLLVARQHAPMENVLPAILARWRELPVLLSTAEQQLDHPAPCNLTQAKTMVESALTLYREVAGELMKRFPERANQILQVSTTAREALNGYLTFLTELPPGDEKRFSIGRTELETIMRVEYLLPYGVDSLLKLGEALFEAAGREYNDFKAYVELNKQNGQDSVYIPENFTRDDVLAYYDWEMEQVRLFLELNEVVTVPEDIGVVEAVETPPYLRSLISGIAYQPLGPFDTQGKALFYVRPIPDSLDEEQLAGRYRYVHRRGFRGSVVHEVYPGHHLQSQIAGRQIDPVRKWQQNPLLVEGWATYCEEMMYRAGLFGREDPNQWLAVLGSIRFRAARIVADVNLHSGNWTYDECVDWMARNLEAETEPALEYIKQEVLRYTITPGYQMAYLLGKLEIDALREAVSKRDDTNFDERAFYDRLLEEGAIAPTLQWDILGLPRTAGLSRPLLQRPHTFEE